MSKRATSPTFLLELPLQVVPQQAKHLRAHFEVARCLYNALLGEASSRLKRMRDDPRWQEARTLPQTAKQERQAVFSALRKVYGFSEYALHTYATRARTSWIAEHIDSNTAQKLATRAYQAVNRVCLGQAKKVRFKSRKRGLDSVEGKSNTTGIRFVLPKPAEGKSGSLVWGKDCLPALIDWDDPVVAHGLRHRIKYVRLIRRRASSPEALGADCEGYRYYAQLVLEGWSYQKPKHQVGHETIGLDIGPSSIAIVAQSGEAYLLSIGAELHENMRKMRRWERKLDRQRRANNPENYDAKGSIKKGRLRWHESGGYRATRHRLASQRRKHAAHRKSVQGRVVHEVMSMGNTVLLEKISYKAWQKQYGKSVGKHAPGMLVEILKRTVARTGGILHEVPTRTSKLSQYCHGCACYSKKPLSQRWHQCPCGIGPVQRDLYAAFLVAHLDLRTSVPSIAHEQWESAETRLRAAIEDVAQRANAGRDLPQSMGMPRARARLPQSLEASHQELVYRHGRLEAVGR